MSLRFAARLSPVDDFNRHYLSRAILPSITPDGYVGNQITINWPAVQTGQRTLTAEHISPNRGILSDGTPRGKCLDPDADLQEILGEKHNRYSLELGRIGWPWAGKPAWMAGHHSKLNEFILMPGILKPLTWLEIDTLTDYKCNPNKFLAFKFSNDTRKTHSMRSLSGGAILSNDRKKVLGVISTERTRTSQFGLIQWKGILFTHAGAIRRALKSQDYRAS